MHLKRANGRLPISLLPIVFLLGLLAACTNSGADSPPVATRQPEPATPVSVAGSNVPPAGRTADGTYYLGDPNAPVTLTDHSDFL